MARCRVLVQMEVEYEAESPSGRDDFKIAEAASKAVLKLKRVVSLQRLPTKLLTFWPGEAVGEQDG